ncbi:hypothetical protein POTOM_061358 [Populus tomentosa]|uniref:Uncharacterized protein n=1 Tax=Populus tomentosa TaxID=118781 RepID=A0A8X7XQC9_POPTO|nr:hypothetical protein POTOM_061358 [Populus tomentosa]
MTPSRARPPESISAAQSVGCDDTGFTLVTRRKKKKDIHELKTRAPTYRVAPSFFPSNLPKMTPSRARPPESISAAQSVGCDDTGFTLVTRRKKKKDIHELKTRAATYRVAPSFFPSNLPKMTPSRARPPESISAAQSVGCDDTGFTLVTRRKKKKDIHELKTRAATYRVAPSFFPSNLPKMTSSRARPPESISAAQSVGCDDTGFTLVTRRKKKKDIHESFVIIGVYLSYHVNSDASSSHQVKGNASLATNTDDKQLNVDASTSHQDKGNAITSLATNTDEMCSEESDFSGETDTDESASDFSDESQLKPSDLGDVNPITPPLSTNNHVRTSPLELPMCITSKQMALPSSSETSSSSQVPPINLPKMTPSRAHPLESISIAQFVGCDDTGFTLVTRRKKKKDIPEMKTRVATHRVAPSFLPSS